MRVDTDKLGSVHKHDIQYRMGACVFRLIGFAHRESNYTRTYLSHVEICCLCADKLKKLGLFPLNNGMFEVLTEQNAAV